ncbi:MAG: hypothetical protein KDD36_13520 [Flavobacteriales bacterium]|nr:hypothetical protein [Flavobacteriales bacterium]
MKVIIPIIESMSPAELENVKRGLMQFSTKRPKKSDPEGSASLKLVDAVTKFGHAYSNDDYCQLIYGQKHDPKFRALKFWLKRRLNELRISDVCLSHNDEVPLAYKFRIQARNYITQSYLYHGQSHGKHVQEFLFVQAVKIGEEWELFEELVEAYYLMGIAYRNDQKKFLELCEKKHYYRKCQLALDRVLELKNLRLSVLESERNLPPHVEAALLEEPLEEMKPLMKEIKSDKFKYFYLSLLNDFYVAKRDYPKADEVAQELLAMVKTNKLVSASYRLGKCYGMLCTQALFQKNYEGVLDYVKSLKEHLNPGTNNMRLTLEHELQALLHLGRYDDAQRTLKTLCAESFYYENKQYAGQYNYYQAVIHFLKGNYSDCFSILQSIRDITDDKAGWNIGVRQLSFMCLVEMGLYQQASATVEQMRKYIDRTKSKVEFRERDRVIYSLFAALNRADFDFNYPKSTMQKLVDRLSDDKGPVAFEPVSSEIVPIHTWFKKHQKKQKKNA